MATYSLEDDGSSEYFYVEEHPLYGSSRLGSDHFRTLLREDDGGSVDTIYSTLDSLVFIAGDKTFEYSNHLGNVLATTSDKKVPVDSTANDTVNYYLADVSSRQRYYPYGMIKPDSNNLNIGDYRFGFNGIESDNELSGNKSMYTTFFRPYSTKLGKWLLMDPVPHPWQSPYNAFDGNPIYYADPSGADGDPKGKTEKTGGANADNNTAFEASLTGDIPTICGNCSNVSGSSKYPEPSQTAVSKPKEVPGWAKNIQAGIEMAKFLPYLSDIENLRVGFQDIKSLSKSSNPLLERASSRLPGNSNLNTLTSEVILDGVIESSNDDQYNAFVQKLQGISDNNEFARQVNEFNSSQTSSSRKTIIILYTDEDVNRDEVFWSPMGLNPTNYARYTEDFNYGLEYGGWKPKKLIWGVRDDFSGSAFRVRGVINIDY